MVDLDAWFESKDAEQHIDLFASNVILPSLAYVYLGTHDRSSELVINALTLAGSACGQVSFGLMADVWGRQRLYGVELVTSI